MSIITTLKDGDRIRVEGLRHPNQFAGISFDSAAAYGHGTPWPNYPFLGAEANIISSHRRPSDDAPRIELKVGDLVRFESSFGGSVGLWMIKAPSFSSGDSLGLTPVDDEARLIELARANYAKAHPPVYDNS